MAPKPSLTLLEPAQTLDDVHKTLLTEPLMTPSELDAFYQCGINDVRGGDRVSKLALGLDRSWRTAFYKAFVAGHPGVGKSTEMTRLAEKVSGRFWAIRFQATDDLDPVNFKPFDVLFLMMMRVVEETARPVSEGGAGKAPSQDLLREVIDWFAQEKSINPLGPLTDVEISPGEGLDATAVWQGIVNLFAILKGEMRFAAARSERVIKYRLERIWSLVNLVNKLLNECNDRLLEAAGREWLFIGEDFEKEAISITLNEHLFFAHSNILRNIECHWIFSIPMHLVYSQRVELLSCPLERIHMVFDTPVFGREYEDFKKGRAALREILAARVSPKLFGPRQMKRLVVASGGNLCDLFAMARRAADDAILRGSANGQIDKLDVDRAINKYRDLYKDRLGFSTSGSANVTYGQKVERLVAIYYGEPEARILDPVLYSLLCSGVIQEFDRGFEFGVHPLVVDILEGQDDLVACTSKKVAGGSE